MRLAIGFLAICGFGAAPLHATPITVISGKVGVSEFGPIAAMGPGASCAHLQSAAGQEPDMGGQGCNDQTMIGPAGNQEPIIDQKTTESLGAALKNTVGLALQGQTDLQAGRGIRYKVDKSDNKAGLDD